MAQPDKPGEMKDVDVHAVSLVGKAANKTKFAIFKSAEGKTVDGTEEQRMEKGLFDAIKDFFTKYGVEKGEVRNAVARQEKASKFYTAFWAMERVLSKMTDEANWSGLIAAAEEFVAVCKEIANGDEAVAKACIEGFAAEVEKAGKKISSARLTKLKDAQAFLAEIIAEAEAEESKEVEKKEDTDMNKEEMLSIIKEALSPVTTRLEAIEKSMAETDPQAGGEQKTDEVKLEDVIKEAITPICERLDAIEKVHGVSNKIGTDTVEKKDESGFWAGAFLGGSCQ